MTKRELTHESLTRSVIGAFYEVYNTLGYGFYEHFYTKALQIERELRGHKVAREVRFPVVYKTHFLGTQRVDMVVDDKLIVESKSTQELHRGAPRQLFSYLHGSTFEIGLLLHFGPEAKFLPVASHNTTTPTTNAKKKGPASTRPSAQGSDPSILESLNPSRVFLALRSWWEQRTKRRQEAAFLRSSSLRSSIAWWAPAEKHG